MSVRMMERVFWAKDLGKTRKLVLLAIADAANDSGFGYLLIETLCKKTDLSRRAIQVALADLCEGEDPVLEKRERLHRSSLFRIHIDRLRQHARGISDREMSIEELWGAGDAPHRINKAHEMRPQSESDDVQRAPAAPRTIYDPFIEPIPPLPTGEAPHEDLDLDLLNGLKAQEPRSIPLVDYVLGGWKKLVEDHPKIAGIRGLNDSRKKKIGARAAEIMRDAPGLNAHDVWDQIFEAIRGSDFLRGEAEPGRGYSKPFTLTLDKILEPKFFIQTLERAANDENHNRVTSDPRTGRRFGPAEQAGREAMQRYLARKQRRE